MASFALLKLQCTKLKCSSAQLNHCCLAILKLIAVKNQISFCNQNFQFCFYQVRHCKSAHEFEGVAQVRICEPRQLKLDQAFLKRPDNLHPKDQYVSRKQDKGTPEEKAAVVKRLDSSGSKTRKYESELDKRKPQKWAPDEHATLAKFAGKLRDQWVSGERGAVVKRQDNLQMETANQEVEGGVDIEHVEDALVDNFYDLPCFGRSQVSINELTVKLQIPEKSCAEFARKLTEMTKLYQNSDNACAQDNVNLKNELYCVKRENECHKREMTALKDKLKSFEAENDALKKRLHDNELEFNVKLQTSEKRCADIEIQLGEMTKQHEKSDKDRTAQAQEIANHSNDLDRAKMANRDLERDKFNLENELKSCKDENIDLKNKLQEVEMEMKIIHLEEKVSAKVALLPYAERRSYKSLDGCNWLDDQAMNKYLELVTKRSSKKVDLPKVFAINALLYRRFSKYGYQMVKRWIPKKIDIFTYEYVFIPIHTGDGGKRHWSLVVADFKRRGIFYYDSLGREGMDIMLRIIDYLKSVHYDRKNKEYDFKDYKVENVTNIPKQTNRFDCGMYVLKYADFLSRGAPFEITQEKMQYYRKCTKVEIFNKQLINNMNTI